MSCCLLAGRPWHAIAGVQVQARHAEPGTAVLHCAVQVLVAGKEGDGGQDMPLQVDGQVSICSTAAIMQGSSSVMAGPCPPVRNARASKRTPHADPLLGAAPCRCWCSQSTAAGGSGQSAARWRCRSGWCGASGNTTAALPGKQRCLVFMPLLCMRACGCSCLSARRPFDSAAVGFREKGRVATGTTLALLSL